MVVVVVAFINFTVCFPDCIITLLPQLAATDNLHLITLNSHQCQHILWHLPEQIKDLNVMSGPKIRKWNTAPFLFIYWIPPYSTWELMSFFLNTEVVLKLVEV